MKQPAAATWIARYRSSPRWTTALVIAAGMLATGAGAQEDTLPQGDDDEVERHGIFIDSLDVRLINVEVYATIASRPAQEIAWTIPSADCIEASMSHTP